MKSNIFILALLCVGVSTKVFKRDYGEVGEFLTNVVSKQDKGPFCGHFF